tara:strand:- start:53 stop:559 length:507 start_codon:yes stop_codon:yes gene_type:complete
MTALQVSEKSEKSLTETLIVVVLVASLMASFIYYFFKHQEQLTRAGFATLAQVFSARVNGIHAQWFMDKKPRFITITSSNIQPDGGRKIKLPVNKSGWVDAGDVPLSCQKIWQFVMEAPLLYMKQPVGAVLIEQQSDVLAYCQYSLPSGEFFIYQRDSGKVSEVKTAY